MAIQNRRLVYQPPTTAPYAIPHSFMERRTILWENTILEAQELMSPHDTAKDGCFL